MTSASTPRHGSSHRFNGAFCIAFLSPCQARALVDPDEQQRVPSAGELNLNIELGSVI